MKRWLLALLLITIGSVSSAGEPSAAERGRDAVYRHPFNPPIWSAKAYQDAWKQWGVAEKPADYDRAFREHYGMHAAPYDNQGLPMGLVYARGLFGKGITLNCLICHASSLFGEPVVGLGNAALDQQAVFDDLFAADGVKRALPFQVSHVRGTADAIAPVAYFLQFRDADLNFQKPIKLDFRNDVSSRPPAWWQIKKKKTRDWTGAIDARSDRVDMAFLLGPPNLAATIKKQEPIFADIREFVHHTPSPKYPFTFDAKRAEKGRELFVDNCARCHGTYGKDSTYPNKIVALETIGTDRILAESVTEQTIEHYNKSWFAQQRGPDGELYQLTDHGGYQAPPLDGVWATAPYFHNASVPTIYHVLNSKARPKVFTRTFQTGKEDYDAVHVGWKYMELGRPSADAKLSGYERRKTYDTSRPGQGNQGHTFGDKFTEEERWAVIEYLKTL